MKIRVMGTKEECEQAQQYYDKYSQDNEIVKSCSISQLYPNRNSINQYRVYIDIVCNGDFGQVKISSSIVPKTN